nr:hypothetical transcript [Hymenolepis microstoma]
MSFERYSLPSEDMNFEILIGENNRQATPSPTDTDSQSVMNLASDMAEQLSTTLQNCLRACVRQHAVPSLLPTTMPSSSSQQHERSPIFPSSSSSNSAAATTNICRWFGSDLNSGSMATSIRSPPPESSQPFNATFTASSNLRSYSPRSSLNSENNHGRMQPPASPMLQIPPPPPPLNVSSWEEVNQMSGGRLNSSSTDFPSETPLPHSSSNSQVPDATFSAKQSPPKRSLDLSHFFPLYEFLYERTKGLRQM